MAKIYDPEESRDSNKSKKGKGKQAKLESMEKSEIKDSVKLTKIYKEEFEIYDVK